MFGILNLHSQLNKLPFALSNPNDFSARQGTVSVVLVKLSLVLLFHMKREMLHCSFTAYKLCCDIKLKQPLCCQPPPLSVIYFNCSSKVTGSLYIFECQDIYIFNILCPTGQLGFTFHVRKHLPCGSVLGEITASSRVDDL